MSVFFPYRLHQYPLPSYSIRSISPPLDTGVIPIYFTLVYITKKKISSFIGSVEMLNNKLNAHGSFTPAAVAPPNAITPEQVIRHHRS